MGWLYLSFVHLDMDCGVGKYGFGGHHLPVYSSLASYQYFSCFYPVHILFPFVNISTLLYIYIPHTTYTHSIFDAHLCLFFLYKEIGVHLLDIPCVCWWTWEMFLITTKTGFRYVKIYNSMQS
jgi:hypothetical protein